MENYSVTLFVSKFGFYTGVLLVILAAIGGFMNSLQMGVMATAAAFVLMIPFFMFCEAAHALVTIAKNSQKDSLLPNRKSA